MFSRVGYDVEVSLHVLVLRSLLTYLLWEYLMLYLLPIAGVE